MRGLLWRDVVIRRQDFPTPARIAAVGLLAGSLLLGSLSMAQAFTQNPATVFINEIHYDNTGTDAGEAVEIAGPAGTDLSGWSIVLYNGSGGAVYTTTALGGDPRSTKRLWDGSGLLSEQRHPERFARRHRPGLSRGHGGPVFEL